jgi:hypothetical protein
MARECACLSVRCGAEHTCWIIVALISGAVPALTQYVENTKSVTPCATSAGAGLEKKISKQTNMPAVVRAVVAASVDWR